MKRLVGFIIFILLLVILFVFLSNKEKSYAITYEFSGYSINEKYDKNDKLYYFTFSKDDNTYDYVFSKKYSSKRKLVNKINETTKNDYVCIQPNIDDVSLTYQCVKDDEYVDQFISGITTAEENEVKEKYNNIEIYNNKINYYIWNGYGITNIVTKKEYNFLTNESYDNKISYKLGDYILFSDYDSSREFSKFYIFNIDKEKISEWKIDYKISSNSYFNGDMDGYIYLFDKKNKVQYKLNIEKKSIEKSSDSNGGVFYDNEWTNYTLNKLTYNELTFNKEYAVNFKLVDNILYYQYKDSRNKIKASNNKVTSIVYSDEEKIYYLSDQYLYKYTLANGEEKLIKNFEWNFSSENKIFIFE